MGRQAKYQQREVRIGAFRILRHQGRIKRRGKTLVVSPKAIQVLGCLIDAGTRSVARDAFIDRVWNGNLLVGDHGLRDAIWELRKLFGDDPRKPRFIQTLPRKGYRLLLEPRPRRPVPYLRHVLAAVSVGLIGFAAWVVALSRTGPQDSEAPRAAWFGPAPVVAGDRQRLAMVREVNGQSDLFVVSGTFEDLGHGFLDHPNGVPAAALQITNSRAHKISPVWAPNHRDLAFMEHDPGSPACRVRVYRAQPGDVATLASDCYVVVSPIGQIPAQLSWSADGTLLAYQARTDGDSVGISAVNLVSGSSSPLTRPQREIDAFPRWSTAGDLAFLRLRDPMLASAEIVVLDDRAIPVLRCSAAPVWGLAWADERHLAVVAALGSPFALWVYDIETGAATATRQPARYLQSAPVGDALIVDRFGLDTPLKRSSLLDESPPLNIDIAGGPLAVDYSPATGSMAVVRHRANTRQLAILSPRGGARVVYSAREIYFPRYSADGRWLGFSARDSLTENTVAMAIDLETETVRRLSSGDRAVFFARWAADGDSYYGLRGVPAPMGAGASLVRIDLRGRVLEKLAQGASVHVVTTDTGGVWWSDDRGVVYRRGAAGEPPLVVRKLKSAYESWTVDAASGTLYFSNTNPDSTEILALDNLSPTPRAVLSLAGHIDPIIGLTLGPERSLIYRRSAFFWHERRAVSIDQLFGSANRGNRRACRRVNDLALAEDKPTRIDNF